MVHCIKKKNTTASFNHLSQMPASIWISWGKFSDRWVDNAEKDSAKQSIRALLLLSNHNCAFFFFLILRTKQTKPNKFCRCSFSYRHAPAKALQSLLNWGCQKKECNLIHGMYKFTSPSISLSPCENGVKWTLRSRVYSVWLENLSCDCWQSSSDASYLYRAGDFMALAPLPRFRCDQPQTKCTS